MKIIISKYLTLSAVVLLTLTSLAYAETSKVEKKSEKVEAVPDLKIKAQDTSEKNSKLKQGKACNFDDLEEARGEEFKEIPMAQTIPCADVDCKNLKPAQLHKDNYKDLPEAKTIKGCD